MNTIDKSHSPDKAPEIGKGDAGARQVLMGKRSISKTQAVLGGLENLRTIIDSDPELSAYISQITYDNKPVLDPYREQLKQIIAGKDFASLDKLITEVKAQIGDLCGALSRYETAEQNRRSLIALPREDFLKNFVAGIKKDGALALRLKRGNVLNLLA